MAFQLSDTVNDDKFFLVKRSELEGRIDCEYYKPERKIFFTRLESNKFVGKLINVIDEGSYGVLPPGDCYDDCHPVKFMRATDLRPDLNLNIESYKKVPQKYYENHKRARLRKNDILLAVKGATIASNKCVAYLSNHIENAIVNGSIFRFQCKDLYLPEFIAFMLELPCTKRQMKYNLVANNAVDYVDKSLINNLLIFLPPIDAQKHILTKINIAYTAKKQKEAQAQQLLDSIDTYLLNELGIELPPLEENNISQRMFIRRVSEVNGQRFDPFFHIPYLVKLDNLFKSKTEKSLQHYANGYASGATPSKDESDIHYTTANNGIPFIRVQNLSVTGELQLNDLVYIKHETHNGLLNRSKVFESDLLVKITGVGRMAVASVAPAGFEGNINQHVVVIRTGSKEISRWLATFINLDSVEKIASKRATGGTRPALDYPALFSLPIIFPPLEKQNEIASHIQRIRDQAKQLSAEAIAGLEQAKREVEAMIIGQH